MDSIYINQGSFAVGATLAPVYIPVRSGFSWVNVYNYTRYAGGLQPTTSYPIGISFYWQAGMQQDTALAIANDGTNHNNGVIITSGGISLVDSTQNGPIKNATTGTSITKAGPPIVTLTGHGYSTGDVVRLTNMQSTGGMQQIAGIDFTIAKIDANSFNLVNMDTSSANFNVGGTFTAYKIPFGPMFYPPRRIITGFTQSGTDATKTIITLSVTHQYVTGQQVRINIPQVWGVNSSNAAGISNVQAIITDIGQTGLAGSTNTITVQFIFPVGFTWAGTFAWPAVTALPITYGEVTPIGLSSNRGIPTSTTVGGVTTYSYVNPYDLSVAEQNTAQLYLVLGTGIAGSTGPAGSQTGDVMYWMAGQNYLTSSANNNNFGY